MTVQANLPDPVSLREFARVLNRIGDVMGSTRTLAAHAAADRRGLLLAQFRLDKAVQDARRLVTIPASERTLIALEAVCYAQGRARVVCPSGPLAYRLNALSPAQRSRMDNAWAEGWHTR